MKNLLRSFSLTFLLGFMFFTACKKEPEDKNTQKKEEEPSPITVDEEGINQEDAIREFNTVETDQPPRSQKNDDPINVDDSEFVLPETAYEDGTTSTQEKLELLINGSSSAAKLANTEQEDAFMWILSSKNGKDAQVEEKYILIYSISGKYLLYNNNTQKAEWGYFYVNHDVTKFGFDYTNNNFSRIWNNVNISKNELSCSHDGEQLLFKPYSLTGLTKPNQFTANPTPDTVYSVIDGHNVTTVNFTPERFKAAFKENSISLTREISYVFKGLNYVSKDQLLNIEAGTVLKFAEGAALIISVGGSIDAKGVLSRPIILTSVEDETIRYTDDETFNQSLNLTSNDRGLWGGLFILGDEPLSEGNKHINGLPQTEKNAFGGANENHDAGALEYISIRHAGGKIGNEAETCALFFGAVGFPLGFDFIEVYASAGDGMRVSGGDIAITRTLISYCNDNGLEFNSGYTGNIRTLCAIYTEGNGIKGSGVSNQDDNLLLTPDIRYVSIINTDLSASKPTAMFFDNGVKPKIYDIFMYNHSFGLELGAQFYEDSYYSMESNQLRFTSSKLGPNVEHTSVGYINGELKTITPAASIDLITTDYNTHFGLKNLHHPDLDGIGAFYTGVEWAGIWNRYKK